MTWSQVFYRTGTNIVTGPTQTTPYVPDGNTIWKTASVNLAAYSNVLLKIVNVTDGGNNLYVDYINIGALPTGIEENNNDANNLAIFPNPSNGSFSIKSLVPKNEVVSLVITDVLGRLIYSAELKP